MTIRLLVAAFVLLGIFAGAHWAGKEGIPSEPAPLEMKADDLPLIFGEWKGADVALDPEVFNAIGAQSVVDRQYRDQSGRAVFLEMAIFTKFAGIHEGLIHSPEVCYNGSGWTLGEAKDIPLDQETATQNIGRLLPAVRQGQTADVLYWFQVDGAAYHTLLRQRSLFLATRGRPLRPPIIKIMLQMNASSPDEAERALKSLAGEIYKWSRGFH